MRLLATYFSALVLFMVMDLAWIGYIAKNFYQKNLGSLLATNPNWIAAAVFYLIFITGILAFVVLPAVEKGSLWQAIALGAFFGLVTYGTYDLTNHATLKNWPAIVTGVDMLWGAFIVAVVSAVAYVVADLNFWMTK